MGEFFVLADFCLKKTSAMKVFLVYIHQCSSVAQLVEQVAVNHWVGGSSPSRGAIFFVQSWFSYRCSPIKRGS